MGGASIALSYVEAHAAPMRVSFYGPCLVVFEAYLGSFRGLCREVFGDKAFERLLKWSVGG